MENWKGWLEVWYKEQVEVRHMLHRNPELPYEERETTRFLKQQLKDWGIQVEELPGLETGVSAVIEGAHPGPMLVLREDIDALPILENTGLLNRFFDAIGLFDLINGLFGTEIEYFKMINTQGAVVLGMVYNFLPFMILPIYSVIVKLDHRLIEAARDLGADSVTVFRRVTLPLSLPGVLSGITMVFVPAVSTFAISHLLGGGKHLLLGNLIEMQFKGSAYNPYLGSAVALVMMVIVVICMSVMNRFGEGEEQAVML